VNAHQLLVPRKRLQWDQVYAKKRNHQHHSLIRYGGKGIKEKRTLEGDQIAQKKEGQMMEPISTERGGEEKKEETSYATQERRGKRNRAIIC